MICATNAPAPLKLQALLHDAAEAYLGDVSSPLKSLLPDYRAVEARMERVIAERFNIPYKGNDHGLVKLLDLRTLATEVRDLMPPSSWSWECLEGIKTFDERIRPWDSQLSEDVFISSFLALEDQSVPSRNALR